MKLYFDIGNTNIKLNFNYKNKEHYFSFKTKKIEYTPDSLFGLMPKSIKINKITKVYIISVVPKVTPVLKRMIEKYFSIKSTILTFPMKTGIKIRATNPKTVGCDLIALSVLAASKSKNAIMINLGTATTITHIKDKQVKGTIIAPGLYSSFDSLVDNAAKIPEINLEIIDKSLGNNTEECLSIGVLKGHIHMLRGFIKDIDSNADTFISGGYSNLIKNYINATYIQEATIEGIKILANLNES